MNAAFDIPKLKAGDILLYGAVDFAGWLTGLKTWSPAVHVELYIGNGLSVASRNGIGVNQYALRTKQLVAVLRPNQPFNLALGMAWFSEPYQAAIGLGVRGRPYGWWDLLRFFNIRVNTNGWICSQFIFLFTAACRFFPFNREYASGSVDPGDYFVSPLLDWVWVRADARRAVGKFSRK